MDSLAGELLIVLDDREVNVACVQEQDEIDGLRL